MNRLLLILVTALLAACTKLYSTQVTVDSNLVIEITPSGVRIGNHVVELPCRSEQFYRILGTPSDHYQFEYGGYRHTWSQFGIDALGDQSTDRIYSLSVVYTPTGYAPKTIYPGRIRIGDALLARDTQLDTLPPRGFVPTKSSPDFKYRLERQTGKMSIAAQANYPDGDGLMVIDSFTSP